MLVEDVLVDIGVGKKRSKIELSVSLPSNKKYDNVSST